MPPTLAPATLDEVIAAATQPGHAHGKAELGEVPDWLRRQAAAHGLDLTAYRHVIDTAALRHIMAKHGDPKIESRRRQIAITEADIKNIAAVLAAPDKLIFGVKGKRNQAFIGIINAMPTGSIVYVAEVRPGRKELAAVTMYKHPATRDAGSLAANFRLNGRTDSGDTIHIVDLPKKVTSIPTPAPADSPTPRHPAPRRAARYVPPLLGILVLIASLFGLHRALLHIRPADIIAALAATQGAQLLRALAFTALSFGFMTLYDLPGILFARQLETTPHLRARRMALASFCAYALSHVLGAAALTAAAIRVRFYAQWGVPPAGLARILALSAVMFTLGTCTLLGGLLLISPADIPLPGPAIPPAALRAAGLLLWFIAAGYVGAAGLALPIRILGRPIPRPGRRLAALQILIAAADIACAAAILHAVLPAAPGLTYIHLLAIYLAAFAIGIVSGLPGGVGVFDGLLLLGLTNYMTAADALGAILLFRILYYLLPAFIAALSFSAHEIWLTARKL